MAIKALAISIRSKSAVGGSSFWTPLTPLRKWRKQAVAQVLLLLCSSGTLIGFADAQGPARNHSDPALQVHAASRLVLMPGVVRLRSGSFASGLNREDFVVLDDGEEQQSATVEQATNQPVAVAMVMQTGGKAYSNFERYLPIIELLKSPLVRKVALVTFDSKPEEIWTFPLRSDGVIRAMQKPDPGDSGASIIDAVSRAADILVGEPPEVRRVIVLLSQPQDFGSTTPPLQLLRRLGQMSAPIYSFSFPSSGAYAKSIADPSCLKMSEAAPQESVAASTRLLQERKRLCQDTAAELATVSGGEHTMVKNQDDLDRATALLSDAFANGYTWSFQPISPTSGFHFLSVRPRTKGSDLTVSARGLYWIP